MVIPSAGPVKLKIFLVNRAIQVSELQVEPSEAIEKPVVEKLIAYLLREGQILLEHAKGFIVVTLGCQGEPVARETFQEQGQ
jgi:hypothetical protein